MKEKTRESIAQYVKELQKKAHSGFELIKYKNEKAYIWETLLFILLINAFNMIFYSNDPGFTGAAFHPYWLVVLLIPSRYGYVAGLVSGLAVSLNLILYQFGGIPTRSALEKFIEVENIGLHLSFVLIGIALGSIRQRYIEKEHQADITIKRLTDINEKLTTRLEVEEKARRIIETRIV